MPAAQLRGDEHVSDARAYDPGWPSMPAAPRLGGTIEVWTVPQRRVLVRQASEMTQLSILFWNAARDSFHARIDDRGLQDSVTEELQEVSPLRTCLRTDLRQ